MASVATYWFRVQGSAFKGLMVRLFGSNFDIAAKRLKKHKKILTKDSFDLQDIATLTPNPVLNREP
jgi:CRISPR/Cas system-associated endoribonuclease Cas2